MKYINLYKENKSFKFYTNLFLVFMLGQMLIGLFIFPSEDIFNFSNRKSFFFIRNFISISYYLFSTILLYVSAHRMTKKTFRNTRWFLILYITLSIFITSLHNSVPYTVFSRIGYLINIFYIQGGIDYTLFQNIDLILFRN